ncbi:hypothetical protein CRG98_044128, partial [Punica granatum]
CPVPVTSTRHPSPAPIIEHARARHRCSSPASITDRASAHHRAHQCPSPSTPVLVTNASHLSPAPVTSATSARHQHHQRPSPCLPTPVIVPDACHRA